MKRLSYKPISVLLIIALCLSALVACNSGDSGNFDSSKPITIVSREDGSGTRSAFIELFGIQDSDKNDLTTKEAIVADKTDIMMSNVSNDAYAIGYISLGSLNNSVKAVSINGIAANVTNVKNGSYPIQRPFFIATKGNPSGLTKDFIDFILSAEGQAVVVDRGYVAIVDNAPAYAGSRPSGKIVVGGSSSVTPLMEKLREEYLKVNTNATIEVQMFDSSAGMAGTIDGTFDIGMASRELKDSELAQLIPFEIAKDGIAVIVNKNNPVSNMTTDQVKAIYTGATSKWSDIQ
ncbi:MAG: substrate-binding domain-containing protein [Coriobacteriales bacterium]|jgi:phosphate transport system substrate-binding protein|nr:substrate-binding domain-containing protein [Coriobacteriales bacterium]